MVGQILRRTDTSRIWDHSYNQNEKQVYIAVEDTGIGMIGKVLCSLKVFERFYKQDEFSTRYRYSDSPSTQTIAETEKEEMSLRVDTPWRQRRSLR